MNLDQKLRRVEYKFMEQADLTRALPYKALEEKMTKFKRE